MLITKVSGLTGKTNQMEIPVTQFEIDSWMYSRILTQDAFPKLNADQREFLMTGSTSEEWNLLFGED